MTRPEDTAHGSALLDLTTDLVSTTTAEGELIYMNRGGRVLLGWSEDEPLEGKRIPDVHPEWAARMVLGVGLPHAREHGTWRGETAVRGTDGSEIPVSQVIVIQRDSAGEITSMATIMREITEEKQLEAQLRSTSEKLQLVLDTIPQSVFWKDADLVYQGCNSNFAAVAGAASPSDIVGKTDFQLAWKREEADFFRATDRRVMEANAGEHHILEPQRQSDGKDAWLDTSKVPLHDERGRVVGILGMFEDVTERKRAEEHDHQRLKMESVGQLAGGVAHDFNNLLAAISGSAELIGAISDETKVVGLVQDILGAVRRAASLTQQLLDFSHKGTARWAPMDLHATIQNAVLLLGRTVDRRIEITTSLDATTSSLRGDDSQLQNLLLNLGVNARDAMKDGGVLHFSTRDVELPAEESKEGEGRPRAGIEIAVRDTGVGMSPEVVAHALEPFYTTKEVGQGTGLGLAAVYGTATKHGGTVEIDSEPGRGTCVRVSLPVDPVVVVTPTVDNEEEAPSGAGLILVVDDEEGVRGVTAAMLETLGYDVVSACDGADGVRLFREQHASIDLVILDMVMPHMNGQEALVAMRAVSPNVKVIFSSGFARDQRVDVDDENVCGFLKKPYGLAELAQRVALALEPTEAGTAR